MEQVKLKILLSLGSAKNLLFLYDREKEPRSKYRQIWRQFLAYFVCQIGSSPPRPRRYFRVAEIRYLAQKRDKYFDAFTRQIFLPLAFYMDQKIGYREFRAKANSRKIQCEHHLVVCLFVCKNFYGKKVGKNFKFKKRTHLALCSLFVLFHYYIVI